MFGHSPLSIDPALEPVMVPRCMRPGGNPGHTGGNANGPAGIDGKNGEPGTGGDIQFHRLQGTLVWARGTLHVRAAEGPVLLQVAEGVLPEVARGPAAFSPDDTP